MKYALIGITMVVALFLIIVVVAQESETRSVRFVDPLQNHAGTI